MKAPSFWKTRGPVSTLLTPASMLYDAVSKTLRAGKHPYRAPVPVICVGNLTAGGTGKTPTAIDLMMRLTERGIAVHAVSRGYRGSETGPLEVDLAQHSAAQVGDEPLLLAAHGPTWIAKDRAAGVRAAAEAGAQVIVMDDGHQNSSVAKDLSLVVVDAEAGFGNERVLPAGPLRERVADGMARADAVVLIGTPSQPWEETFHGRPVLRAALRPRYSGISLDGVRVFAFAGIGRPEKFFATVKDQGGIIVDSEAFPDHHVYTRGMVERLMTRANAQDLMVVTTEKDMVKLPSQDLGRIWPVPVGLVYDKQDSIERLLEQITPSSQ